MANWITKTTDPACIVLDSICLAESIWWGAGEEASKEWDHGIYAWRQLCVDVSPWLHSAWQRACELQGWEISFDCEFCEVIGTRLLQENTVQFHPYKLQRWVEEEYGDAKYELKRLLEDDADDDEIREAIGRVLEGL